MPIFGQVEFFSNINLVFSYYIFSVSFVLLTGFLFLAALSAYTFSTRRRASLNNHKNRKDAFNQNGEEKFENNLLLILSIFFLPCFILFSLNNLDNFEYNLTALAMDLPEKQERLVCAMDKNQGLGGLCCGLFPFMRQVRESVPAGSALKIAAYPGTEAYLRYFLFPDYIDSQDADYGLYYFPEPEYLSVEDRRLYDEMFPPAGKIYPDWQLHKEAGAGKLILKRSP